MSRTLPDLTGQTFGKLTVLHVVPTAARGQTRYLVQCACGSPPIVRAASPLLRGHVRSCGCLKGEHLHRMKRAFGRYRRRAPEEDPTGPLQGTQDDGPGTPSAKPVDEGPC